MSLKQKTVSGVTWSAGARAAVQVLQFGISVTLVRLLTPEDFGHLAMALVFVGFAQIFNDLGFGAALVQRREIEADHLNSVFWVNMAMGAALVGVFYLAAPLIASFYGAPVLEPLTRVLGGMFALAALGIVPHAVLQRAMTFDALAKIQVGALAVSGAVAIGMALAGFGLWSLAAQQLVQRGAHALLAWFFVAWRPRWHFSVEALRDVLGFSAGYSGFNFINYWARKSDDLLIGRLIGGFSLGLYDRAYKLMLLPITEVAGVISKVMLPALSAIQDDPARVRRIYLRTMGLLALVVFPAMAGLFVVAEPFVRVVFGAKWLGTVPLIKVLCFVGLTQALCNPTGWIYTSQGRTDWMFWWGVFGSSTLITAIVIGVSFGTVQAVALAYLAANVLITYPCIAIPGRLIGMTFGDVLRAVVGPLTCASLMAGGVWALGRALPPGWAPLPRLAAQVAAGVVLYAALVAGARLQAFQWAWGMLKEQRAGRT